MWYSLLGLETTGQDRVSAQVTVNEGSLWFAGHFPDNPILPGIAQVHMVVEVIAVFRREKLYIQRLSRVKFKKLVRPGELLVVQAEGTTTKDSYTFRITNRDEDVCSGMMSLAIKQ